MIFHYYNKVVLVEESAPKDVPEGVYFLPIEIWDKIRFSNPDTVLTVLQVYKFFDNPEIL